MVTTEIFLNKTRYEIRDELRRLGVNNSYISVFLDRIETRINGNSNISLNDFTNYIITVEYNDISNNIDLNTLDIIS